MRVIPPLQISLNRIDSSPILVPSAEGIQLWMVAGSCCINGDRLLLPGQQDSCLQVMQLLSAYIAYPVPLLDVLTAGKPSHHQTLPGSTCDLG